MASQSTAELLKRAREASGWVTPAKEKLPDGYEQTEVPVPHQHRATAFEKAPERISIGDVQICRRCGGRPGKRSRELGYFPDPDLRKGKDGLFIRCRRCNGFGIIRNDGI